MKKLTLSLLIISSTLFSEELKVTKLTEDPTSKHYQSYYSLLCINGYQWLKYAPGYSSIHQMFEKTPGYSARPIPCQN